MFITSRRITHYIHKHGNDLPAHSYSSSNTHGLHPSFGFRHSLFLPHRFPTFRMAAMAPMAKHGAQELSLDFRVQLAKLIIALSRRDEAEVVRLDKAWPVGTGWGGPCWHLSVIHWMGCSFSMINDVPLPCWIKNDWTVWTSLSFPVPNPNIKTTVCHEWKPNTCIMTPNRISTGRNRLRENP